MIDSLSIDRQLESSKGHLLIKLALIKVENNLSVCVSLQKLHGMTVLFEVTIINHNIVNNALKFSEACK